MEFNFNTKSEILNFNFMHDTQKKCLSKPMVSGLLYKT